MSKCWGQGGDSPRHIADVVLWLALPGLPLAEDRTDASSAPRITESVDQRQPRPVRLYLQTGTADVGVPASLRPRRCLRPLVLAAPGVQARETLRMREGRVQNCSLSFFPRRPNAPKLLVRHSPRDRCALGLQAVGEALRCALPSSRAFAIRPCQVLPPNDVDPCWREAFACRGAQCGAILHRYQRVLQVAGEIRGGGPLRPRRPTIGRRISRSPSESPLCPVTFPSGLGLGAVDENHALG